MRRSVSLASLLLRINRTAVNVAIGIVFVATVVGSFLIGLVDLLDTAHVQAEVLADNSSAAINFHDRAAAARLLGSLRHAPGIQVAELFDTDKRSFARYVRAAPGESRTTPAAREPDLGIVPFFLHVRQEVGSPDGPIGTLYLAIGLDSLLRRTAWIAVITLVAAAAALWVSSLLLRHLDGSVLGPLQALNHLMAKVHGRSDFTVRARRSHIVEIDALGRGFNEMIEAIHERDRQLAKLAYFDVLTGLPNRSAFLERLDGEVQRALHGGHRLGLMFLDLDGFKQVNDTLGHDTGDRLLVEAAERIREALRPSDAAARAGGAAYEPQSARLGGDEFTVLLPELRSADDAMVVACRIGAVMRRPFYIGGRELAITASIGVAVFPEDGRDVLTLLQHADTAMYDAKRSGRDNARRFSADLAKPVAPARAFDTNLRESG